ncbi:MAG: cation:proton antiporter [Alphaproteobacteria bacterium]|nr:cation:proton antiporter [Alphaproteobacteria bacterium]
MGSLESLLITVGLLLLAGVVAWWLSGVLRLPRVTVLLLVGLAVGPAGLDLLPAERTQWFPALADVALTMVGFLLGGEFTASALRQHGRSVVILSLAVSVGTAVVVTGGLLLVGVPLPLALLLGAIAPATDPAAVSAVCAEHHEAIGRASPNTRLVLGIVAIDDVWGLLLFSAIAAVATSLTGNGAPEAALVHGLWELGGALALGGALGVPMAYLSGRISPGEPTLEEAMGMVFLCVGLALWLKVSYLLSAVVMGAVVANLATHHERPFRAIDGAERPFLVLFFILSGASLSHGAVTSLGVLGAAYIGLRVLGRLVSAWLGASWARQDPQVRRWMGVGLLPQAGVALGLALVASETFPDLGEDLLAVAVVSTVVFELAGPLATRLALSRMDAPRQAG